MRTIRTQYGHYLFKQGDYDAALALFQELETDPKEVIALYPPSISGLLHKPGDHTPLNDINGAQNHDDDAEHTQGRTDGPDRDPDAINDDAAAVPYKAPGVPSVAPTLVPSVITSWFNAGHSAQRRSPHGLTGPALEEAVTYLIRFLTDRRQKISKAVWHQQQAISEKEEDQREAENIMEMARLVDTVLLKAYIMTNESLVGPLLRLQNSCEVEECEVLLLEKKVLWEMGTTRQEIFACGSCCIGRVYLVLDTLNKQTNKKKPLLSIFRSLEIQGARRSL